MLDIAKSNECSSLLRLFSVYLVIAQLLLPICHFCDAKPSPAGSLTHPKVTHGESRILADTPTIGLSRLFYTARPSSDSKVGANADGIQGEPSWQASARLPTEHTSGGNENSRPKTDDLLTPTTTFDGQRAPMTFSNEDETHKLTSSRQRNNRRLHKLGNVNNDDHQELSEGGGMGGLDDGGMHTDENDEEEPLVQSLTAMASHLIEQDDSLENSAEKDVYVLNHGGAQQRPQNQQSQSQTKTQNGAGSPAHEQEESGSGAGPEMADDDGSRTGESQLPKIPSESKTLVPNANSPWYDEDGNLIPRTTTPKGLTTWSAINSGETGFKGTVQRLPSDYTVSGLLAFAEQNRQSTTPRPGQMGNVYPTPEIESTDIDFGTTEIARTTKINSAAAAMAAKRKKQQPPTVVYNRYKPRPRPQPTKFIKPQLEDVVATPISQDATHTTFQVIPASAYDPEKKTEDIPWTGSRYSTRKPQWPRNPTTPKPPKRTPFSKVTKRPLSTSNPYLKRTQMPILTLTTPTPTTTTQATSTVYYTRNPVAAGVSPFINVHWSNMPFFDFVRTQIIPRIGLSLLSFAATSPLIFTLLGASGAGRKKRDTSEVETGSTHAEPRTFDLKQLLSNIGLSAKNDALPATPPQKPSRQWHKVEVTKKNKPHADSNAQYRFKWNNYKKTNLSKKNVKYTPLT